MRSYVMAKYIPKGVNPDGTENETIYPAYLEAQSFHDEVPLAEQALQRYVADLEQRFVHGGVYNTRRLPTGEEFREIVCGHPFGGATLCRCLSPLLAVQLFVDAVERYVIEGRTAGTVYWRVYPHLRSCTDEWQHYEEDFHRTITTRETRYAIRARLLVLP